MPRTAQPNGLSIARLETILRDRKGQLIDLRKQRDQLSNRVADLDRKIMSLEGRAGRGGAGMGRGRARNAHSLVEMLETVLGGSSKPMKIQEIVDGVQSKGYRSSSPNFRGIVNQTLIKEKQFQSAGRGLYQLKK